tara:strand:- start:10761 stop:11564 length:804 start_codon:yes stop_codon:yes gene_type:complete
MTLTFDTVTAHIRHTLGGDVAASNDLYAIINDAGDYMASMHPWRWLEDVDSSLTGADNVHWIALPTGFVELTGFAPRGVDSQSSNLADAAKGVFYSVSMQEINDKREQAGEALNAHTSTTYNTVPNGAFYFAVNYTNSGTGVPQPRLELFPTPRTTANGNDSFHGVDDCKLTVAYRMSWAQVTTPSSVFSLPQWMEPLYLQCVRAVARGYEEEDLATVNARLSEVANGPMFQVAVQRDSLIESTTVRVTRRNSPVSLAGPAKADQQR